MGNETKLNQRILHLMRHNNSNRILGQRVETGVTGLGVPDIFFRSRRCDGWIESKAFAWPTLKETYIKIPYRPGQLGWISLYREKGGKVFLVCLIDNGRLSGEVFCFEGYSIQEVYSQKQMIDLNCGRFDIGRLVSDDRFLEMLDNK